MVYSKHTPKSRKYRKSEPHSKDHNLNMPNLDTPISDEHALPPAEVPINREKKNPPAFGFLTSLFGSGDRTERSEKALFNILGHDIYLDDLILVGLILLLLTDKIEDEILLIILAYLLLDIF
ncbi:hypothetical protein EHE19_003315 [Ruminiclostridium herbifermentans]|uniref:Uncharacterized protein n=1 Tax=Ruminiclostridium herbifermentans TaxID=2488810 RepID=A0A4U7JJU0_9FIRM|nr:hypothetical protein [Ruminiclostridium herbifermentans]QNU68730.1 hypothetical protein EHE19_003315 [Ruminiclostridium herbifermentans]